MSETVDDIRAEAPAPARRPLLLLFGAGVGGGAWSALVQIAATPFYLRLLGVDSYGLIGFYTALQALLQVLDLGISLMTSREVARLTAERKGEELRDLVRTLELLYWLAAIVVGGALVAAAPALARGWFPDARIGAAELQRALVAMAFLWIVQWLTSFYQAALIGMERFVALSLLKISSSTAMHVGGVLWLLHVSSTASALFTYQAVAVGVHLLAYVLVMTRGLLPTRARVRFALLGTRGRFAGAIAGITACGALLAQSDKVIVSRIVPLREFGVYALASLVASSIFIVVVPLFQAVLPRLSAFAATGDDPALRALYRASTQAVAVLAVAPACVLALLGREVIELWTRNPDVARGSAAIASVLLIGSALNAMMTAPYALQLAMGRTRFALTMAAAQLLVFVPLVIVLAQRYGSIGAAAAWPLIHAAYVIIGIPYTHRRLLGASTWQWVRDAFPPALVAFAVAALASRLPRHNLATIAATSLAALLAGVVAAPRVREATLTFVRRLVQA